MNNAATAIYTQAVTRRWVAASVVLLGAAIAAVYPEAASAGRMSG